MIFSSYLDEIDLSCFNVVLCCSKAGWSGIVKKVLVVAIAGGVVEAKGSLSKSLWVMARGLLDFP